MYALQKVIEFFGNIANHICNQGGLKRYLYLGLLISTLPVWLISIAILSKVSGEVPTLFIVATSIVMLAPITTFFIVTDRLQRQREEERFKRGLPKMLRSGKFYKTPFKWW